MKAEIVKACDRCGKGMVVRQNNMTGEDFLGCDTWPECKFTMPLPVDVEMQRAGAQRMEGF